MGNISAWRALHPRAPIHQRRWAPAEQPRRGERHGLSSWQQCRGHVQVWSGMDTLGIGAVVVCICTIVYNIVQFYEYIVPLHSSLSLSSPPRSVFNCATLYNIVQHQCTNDVQAKTVLRLTAGLHPVGDTRTLHSHRQPFVLHNGHTRYSSCRGAGVSTHGANILVRFLCNAAPSHSARRFLSTGCATSGTIVS
jgi:hypothetical protein